MKKNISKIETIFLFIFFILLFIPMSHINHNSTSMQENRTLAQCNNLFNQGFYINDNIGKDFNNWFNDRFAFRELLIKLDLLIKYIINNNIETSKAFYLKANNRIFVKEFLNIKFDDNDIISISKNLSKLASWCKQHNIKLYILIVPYQDNINYEYLTIYNNPQQVLAFNTDINNIINKSNAEIIYPYKELYQATKNGNYPYFKVDHHWTDLGAFIGYNILMRHIRASFEEVLPISESQFNITYSKLIRSDWERDFYIGWGILHGMPILQAFSEQILDTEYKYYDHKKSAALQTEVINTTGKKQKNYYYPFGSDLRVIQMGTSMNENLTQFTPYTFKHLKYIRLNNIISRSEAEEFKVMKYYKQEILDYKPDIMILCITINNLFAIKNLFVED